jgi:hypothetical protein
MAPPASGSVRRSRGSETITFPPIVTAAGPGAAYAMYLAFTLLSLWFVRRFVAETKGRTLEQA